MTRPANERAARLPRPHRPGRVSGSLILLALLAPIVLAASPAAAQVTAPSESGYLQLHVEPQAGYVQVAWKGDASIPVRFVDASRDNAGGNASGPHLLQVSAKIETPGNRGWDVTVTPSFLQIQAGQTVLGTLTVSTAATTELRTVLVNITAVLTGPAGYGTITRSTVVQAILRPYHAGDVLFLTAPPVLAPGSTGRLAMRVSNLGAYPDVFHLHASITPGWGANLPSEVSLGPGESAVVNATLLTPGSGYYYQGDPAVVTVTIRSALDPGAFSSSRAWTASVEGAYLPPYALPAVPLLAILGVLAITRGMERRERRVGERGRPRRPKPTREQRGLLRELRTLDPEAYKRQLARLAAIRRERREIRRSVDPREPLPPLPDAEAPSDSREPEAEGPAPDRAELEERLQDLRDRLRSMRGGGDEGA